MNIKHRRKVTVKMKRKKLCTMLMGLVFSFSLTGCGTSLYEMNRMSWFIMPHMPFQNITYIKKME